MNQRAQTSKSAYATLIGSGECDKNIDTKDVDMKIYRSHKIQIEIYTDNKR